MRRILAFLLLFLFRAPQLFAQYQSYDKVPRYEIGGQIDIHHLDGVGEWGGGFGARFHYNFDPHFALDAEVLYRQHDIFVPQLSLTTSPAIGQTTGLFGVRAGQRFEDYGFFAHARAGFLHFGSADRTSLLSRQTFPAIEVGGTIENYRGPIILRFDLGEMIVPYGSATVASPQLIFPPQLPGQHLGTRASPLVGFGFAVRF